MVATIRRAGPPLSQSTASSFTRTSKPATDLCPSALWPSSREFSRALAVGTTAMATSIDTKYGGGHCERHVRVELSRFLLDEHDRHKHEHRGQGGCEHGWPHSSHAVDGGAEAIQAATPRLLNALQDHYAGCRGSCQWQRPRRQVK